MKKLSLILTAIVTIFILVACGTPVPEEPAPAEPAPAEPEPTEPAELPLVRYANFQVYDPVYVGIDQEIFQEHGVNAEIVGSSFGGPTAIQAVASGKADAGLTSYPALINAIANGLPVIGVADSQTETEDSPKEIFLVRADDDIKSIADTEGKVVAVNLIRSSFHYTWLMAYDQLDIDEADVTFVNLPFSAIPEALQRGDIDAGGIMEPYATMAEINYPGEFERLYVGSDVFGQRQFTVIFVNSIWAKENPEVAERFTDAVKESAVWANENPDEANVIVGEQLDIPAESIPFYEFTKDGGVVVEDAQFWLDFMQGTGHIAADWMTVDDVVTEFK